MSVRPGGWTERYMVLGDRPSMEMDDSGDRSGHESEPAVDGPAEPVHRARRACREQFGEPRLVASAPGRINLVGGHTDYNDGLVLPVAIDRRTAVAAHPRDDDVVRVHSLAFGETATATLNMPRPDGAAWADYVRGVVDELEADGLASPGADLVIASDVPVGGGLASSAALTVATAFGLVAMGGGDPTTARRSIANCCLRAETDYVGVPCGPMDPVTAACGRADATLLLDCRSGELEYLPLDRDVAIIVVDSTVTHDLAESAYAQRRRACERGVQRLATRLDGVEALRDVSIPSFEEHASVLPEPVRSRCRHVVHEIDRVRTAATALRRGDVVTVGEQMTASHSSLRDEYGVSCPALERLVDRLDRPGVYGARLTGAGFGGCVVALVEAAKAETIAGAVARAYATQTDGEPRAWVCRADDGATVAPE